MNPVLRNGPQDPSFFKSFTARFGDLADEQLRDPYRTSVIVYACIQCLVDQIVQAPLALFDEEGDRVEDPVWDNLFANPHPFLTRSEWMTHVCSWFFLYGEVDLTFVGMSEPFEAGDIPTEIWPFPPYMFDVTVDPDTSLVDHWEMITARKRIPFAAHEVQAVKMFNPRTMYRGMSPLTAATLNLQSARRAEKFNDQFFSNDATPGGILTYAGHLNPEERDVARAQWENRFSGNRARTAVLGEGWEYQAIGSSHQEMQFFDQFNFTESQIIKIYRVPRPVLMEVEGVTYGPAMREVMKAFWKFTIMPRLNFFGEVLTNRFRGPLPPGTYIHFDTQGIEALTEEEDLRLDRAKKLKDLGIPLNMVGDHLELDLPENIPGADTVLVPATLMPIEQVIAEEPEPEPEPEKQVRGMNTKQKDAFWRAYVRKINDPYERRVRKVWRDHVFRVRKWTLMKLSEKDKAMRQPQFDLSDVIFGESFDDELIGSMTPILNTLGVAASEQVLEELGELGAWGLEDPRMSEFMKTKAMLMKDSVHGTLREQIRKQLLDAMDNHETLEQMKERLRGTFNMAKSRAATIARTEVAEAASGVRHMAFKAEGVKKHEWITAGDEKVRDSHVTCGKAGVQEIGFDYGSLKGVSGPLEHPSFMGAPAAEVINCRCVAVPVME
jgi:HK97 family phage portal protein